MQTFIHEMGVVDKIGKVHPVYFNKGLNVVTGRSSTGKSALIEIFDYCFGSGEYTVPKGVITNSASIYYVYLNVNGQDMVIARSSNAEKKGFFQREDEYDEKIITADYFSRSHFIPLDAYKKHLRSFFLDIDDVDDSLEAKANRRNNAKAPTPSIRSFVSFMLQHQNLVANKHALFYRFDEKEKRDQAIEHTKIFLGLVDQNYFHLSQEKERLTIELNRIKREQDSYQKVVSNQKQKVEPVLRQLYAAMGFSEDPVSIQDILRHPLDAKQKLEQIIRPESIDSLSDEQTQLHFSLKHKLALKTSQIRRLQTQAGSINHNITEDKRFLENSEKLHPNNTVNLAKSVCPFCNTEHEQLHNSAEHLQLALSKLSNNLQQAKPMRARFASSLIKVKREIEILGVEATTLKHQINDIEQSEKELAEKKDLFESVLMTKARLYMLLETISLTNDLELSEQAKSIKSALKKIELELSRYDYRSGLKEANRIVNKYMSDIGQHFEFEDSYQPINLHFSFETFDLYHETSEGEKIYLRSMGSGANWLYCHTSLFLALHKYFASLGERCAVPSILFLDQPTQVYFPSFRYDKSEKFDKESIQRLEQRDESERKIDDDMTAVENLFSQLSIYCKNNNDEFGFSPQIIVTDHADDLTLSDGTDFESLVNGNRWRKHGLINPIPSNES